MTALDKVAHVGKDVADDLSHVFQEVGSLLKSGSMKLATDAAAMTNSNADKHLPACTIGDFAGTVPRDCEFVPKKTSPSDIPPAPKEPNKFGPDDPRFE